MFLQIPATCVELGLWGVRMKDVYKTNLTAALRVAGSSFPVSPGDLVHGDLGR